VAGFFFFYNKDYIIVFKAHLSARDESDDLGSQLYFHHGKIRMRTGFTAAYLKAAHKHLDSHCLL